VTPWTEYRTWIGPLVPGVTEPMLTRAVCDAAIEFCDMTQATIERFRFFAIPRSNQYELEVDCAKPGMVLGVTLGGRELKPVYLDALYNAHGEAWHDHKGTPEFYLGEDPDTLRVYPSPTTKESGFITVVVRPSRSSQGFSTQFFEHYGEIVSDGALARLLSQPNMPWHDPREAMNRRVLFQRGVNKVRARVMGGHTTATFYADHKGYNYGT